MSIRENNAKIVSTCGQRLTALKKHVRSKTAMKVSGQPKKLADLVAVYQAAVDTRAALIPQRAAYDKALAARDDAEAARVATDKELRVWVVNEFGPDSQEAAEFGFLPPKVTEKSAETKATAVKKLRATREARGTKGKRQKAHIKGTIDDAGKPAPPTDPGTNTATNGASKDAPPSDGATASH
jgi:hypothetical protein